MTATIIGLTASLNKETIFVQEEDSAGAKSLPFLEYTYGFMVFSVKPLLFWESQQNIFPAKNLNSLILGG
jgi:hypothetical protein